MATDVWIFGYGSLIFRPDFPFIEQRIGFVTGWSRRFWQASIDHRGTPDAPGRVVTLVAVPGATTWGVAYRVAAEHREQVLAQLDERERGGYQRRELPFSARCGAAESAIVYVADEQNPQYVGPEEESQIAAIVRAASGPSGHNREYVLRLSEALTQMGADDAHVFAIARALVVEVLPNEAEAVGSAEPALL